MDEASQSFVGRRVGRLTAEVERSPFSPSARAGIRSLGDNVAPSITVPAPAQGSFINDPTPLVIARYSDGLSGIDAVSFSAQIDSVDRTSLFVTRSDEASATSPSLSEGPHTVIASVADVAGNTSSATTTFTVDLTAPVLSFAAPAEGTAHPQPSVGVTLNLYDALSGIDPSTLRIRVNGIDRTALFAPSASQATATLQSSVLVNGANQIQATVRDVATNEASATLAFSIDTTAPVLAIGQPVDGARLGSSSTPVIVQFSDDQALSLSAFTATLDGAPLPMTVTPESATALVTLAEGAHTFTTSIADRAGNVTTREVRFTVDTQVPSIVVDQPAPSFLLPTATPFVALNYSDAQGVDTSTLRILVDGVDRTSLFAIGPESATATLSPVPEGDHTVTAEIRDFTGNRGTTTASFTTDTLAPLVTIVAPGAGSRPRTATPEIRFGYQDGAGSVEPSTIRVFLDGIDLTAAFVLGGTEGVGAPPSPLSDGNHTLRVEVGDRASNIGSAEITFLVDTLAPKAVVEGPADGSFTNDETPELRISIADIGRDVLGTTASPSGVDVSSVRVFLRSGGPDALEVELTSALAIDAASVSGTIPGPLPAGTHRLRASLSDRAGNTFETLAAFEVDVTPPTFRIVTIAPGAGVPTATPSFEIEYADDRSGIDAARFTLRVDGVDRTSLINAGPASALGTMVLDAALADGPHSYEFTLFDRAGNRTESGPLSFVVDTVAPTATMVEPAAGAFVGVANPALAITLTDPAPSSGMNTAFAQMFLDGVEITGSAALAFAVIEDSAGDVVVRATGRVAAPLSDGLHTLRVTAVDNANNPVELLSQFSVDTTPPTVTPAIPETGTTVGPGGVSADGRTLITGTLNDLDPGLTVTCAAGTNVVAGVIENGAYSCSLGVAEGINEVTVTVTDSTGHSTTATRDLTVDRTPPVVAIDSPTSTDATAAEYLTVAGHVVDATAVSVTVNGIVAVVTPAVEGAPATFVANNVPVGPGPTASFTALVTDAAANTGQATVTIAVDRVAPVVTIARPTAGAYLRAGLIQVEVEVVDASTTLTEVNGMPAFDPICAGEAAGVMTCRFVVLIPLVGDGTIVATAIDAAGNIGRAQIATILDSAPPTIVVTSPAALLVTGAAIIEIAGVVTDASPVSLTLNGQTITTAPDGAFNTSIPAGADGPRDLVFVATDAAGNQASVTTTIVIDRTSPGLSIAVPVQGSVVVSVPMVVSGTVVDATTVRVFVGGEAATVIGQAWSATLTDLAEGALSLTVRAVDAAGNESIVAREVDIDLSPPSVEITAPAPGALTRDSTVMLAISVLDRSTTSITVNGAPVATACPAVAQGQAGALSPCDRTHSVELGDGDNTFVVEATDAGGRTAAAQVTITRDGNAPSVELLAPETASRGRVATANVSAVDNLAMASVEVRVVGAVGSTVLCSGTSACAGPIVIPEQARPGDSLTLTATATDTAGNVTTTSRTVRVTSDGVVTGTVLNDLTSLPLAGATVTLLGPNTRSTTTNEVGRYNVPVVEISAILRIEKAGMTSVDRVVSVNSGTGTVLVDARLTPLAESTNHSPVVPATNPPAVIRPGLPYEGMGMPGPVSLAAEGAQRVTLLSAQGLPNLLPPGFAPLTAFNWIPENTSAAARVTVALPTGTVTLPETVLVRYDTAMRDWRVVAKALVAVAGVIEVDLIGTGSYALVVPDAASTVPEPVEGSPVEGTIAIGNVGEPLAGIAIATIPATATSEGRVDPPVLPPTGGTATGLLRIDSPTPLPSGTIVQADLEETYTLASGEEASAPKRSIDVIAFKHSTLATVWGTGDNAGTITNGSASALCAETVGAALVAALPDEFHLCAAFPITPSRTYSNASLREGRVRLDLLAGRENARGVVGGSEAMTVVAGSVQLNVAAGSLAEDTAIALWSYDDYSPFIPTTNGITPLGEVTVDFASSTLNTSAALTFRNVAAVPGDTLVVARVDRAAYDGIPRLQVVALADVVSANDETNAVTRVDTGLPGLTLEGVKKEGRYTLLRLPGPIGWITGTTTASGSPVRALVTSESLPFVATSNTSGVYAIPAVPGPVTLTARVLGQSLIGAAQTTAVEGAPATVNLLLEGAVSQATITPASGAIGVEVNDLLTLTSPVALNPTTVNATNITLRTVPTPPATGSITVPLRLVLSGSGKQLSIIPTGPITTPPTPALAFSTTYALEITGLLDTVVGLVTAPTTTFRTKDDIKPVYDLKALTFSFPDADGLVTVSAPNGTFPPGTEILIINSGNGVVVGFTAGNDGQVSGTIPASTSDTLLVTVTDPFGNTTSFESSKFVDPATGQTAIGPGGGTIEGPQGTAIHIPEGALSQGVAFKLDVLTPEDYDQQFPNQRPAFGDRPVGTVLKISAAQPGTFHRPVKLTFNVPGNFATTHPGADPRDAVFYALKRSTLPGGAVGFEIVDHAFAVCPGDTPGGDLPARDDPANPTCDATELSVKTASPPHPELTGNFLADTYILLTYDWASAGARTALAGAVVGRVRRQAWGGGQQAGQVQYEAVEGAVVSGSDAGGNPLQSGNGLIAISQKDGTYTLWDSAYQGGTVTVHALAGNETATGVGFEGNPQDVSASWGPFQTLRFYQNKAHVDVVFEAQAPPPPRPDVDIVVMRDVDGVDTKGLSAAGVPLRIGFKNNRQGESVTIGSLDINGANFTVTTDSSGKFAGITQNVWTPAQPGTYILTTTALSPIGGSIPLSTTVRIVAAGGNVDTDQAQPPRVVDQQTYPKRGAKNVQTSVFPTITFSEPVVNITHSTVQLTRVDLSAAAPVLPAPIADAIKISGVTAGNQVIDDVTTAPTLPFTSITIRPLNGLKYRQQYTLTLTDGIRDLDTTEGAPSPKSLVPYATTFDTFGPESIPPDGEPASTTTTGFYVAKNANGEPLSMWSLKHQIIGSNWQALLTGYDLGDPINVVETTSLGILGRPIDLAGEGSIIAVATAPGVKSIPSNVRLYDVSNPLSPLWVGAASLTKTLSEGTVNRITLRGNRVYAGTYRKGIQMLDVDAMKSALPPCCEADHVKVISDLNLDQKGFNEAAIIATVPVPGPGGQASYFTGLKSIAQSAEPLVVAIGNFGLALARESSPGATLYRGTPSKDGETLQYGLALDVANVEGYDLAVVAAASGAKQVLMVVDVTNPEMPPVIRSVRDIAAGDRGVVDVLVNGTVVYVSTQKATTPPSLEVEVFDISDPDTIAHLGHIAGVGGRLSIVGKLLYGATSGTFGAPVEGLGGVRTAALGKILLIKTTGGPFPTRLGLSREAVTVELTVVPEATEITTTELALRKGTGEPQILPVNDMKITFPKGSSFDPSFKYAVAARVNAGTPDEISSGERSMRPVEIEYSGTLEADDDERRDALPVFDPRPYVELDPVPAPTGPTPSVTIRGLVSDPLTPIQKVLIGNEVVSVTQTTAGTSALGPFVGTFQFSMTLKPHEHYITATATNSLGNTGWDGVWFRPNISNDGTVSTGTVPPWVAEPLTSIPPTPADRLSSAFRAEVRDLGLGGVPSVAAELRAGGQTTPVVLTLSGATYRSEQMFLVPERFQIPTGLDRSLEDKLKATRIRSRLGTKPVLGTRRTRLLRKASPPEWSSSTQPGRSSLSLRAA